MIVTSDEPSKLNSNSPFDCSNVFQNLQHMNHPLPLLVLLNWDDVFVAKSDLYIWGKWFKFPPEMLHSNSSGSAPVLPMPGSLWPVQCWQLAACDYALINSSMTCASGRGLGCSHRSRTWLPRAIEPRSHWPIRARPGAQQPITGQMSPPGFAID